MLPCINQNPSTFFGGRLIDDVIVFDLFEEALFHVCPFEQQVMTPIHGKARKCILHKGVIIETKPAVRISILPKARYVMMLIFVVQGGYFMQTFVGLQLRRLQDRD